MIVMETLSHRITNDVPHSWLEYNFQVKTMATRILAPTLLVVLTVTTAGGQFFLDNSLQPTFYQTGNGFQQLQEGPTPAHHEVLDNAARESQLPQELLNPFYKNPSVAAGLARESLIANKEFPVYHRDTQDIPRSEIFKVFQRAGFHDKNRRRR